MVSFEPSGITVDLDDTLRSPYDIDGTDPVDSLEGITDLILQDLR